MSTIDIRLSAAPNNDGRAIYLSVDFVTNDVPAEYKAAIRVDEIDMRGNYPMAEHFLSQSLGQIGRKLFASELSDKINEARTRAEAIRATLRGRSSGCCG